MNNYSNYWDKKLPNNLKDCTYQEWLKEYQFNMYSSDNPILDLGCGNGEDTIWLKSHNYKVVSLDFSKSSIERVKQFNEDAELFDMTQQTEWEKLSSNSFSYVIANLSLHYFDTNTTNMIMNEIKRILIKNGKLIARVNTTLDKQFGAGDGIEKEPNFYRNLERGIDKRFFTEESIKTFFSIIGEVSFKIKQITYIGKQKQCFEVVVQKI